jgi:hypothetical protein
MLIAAVRWGGARLEGTPLMPSPSTPSPTSLPARAFVGRATEVLHIMMSVGVGR